LTQAAGADGYLLLDKRAGLTSFDSLSALKRALSTRRIGHTGTLDKFAEGLLVVLVGRSTRLVPWFSACGKEYEGTISFGDETDTLDPEGTVVASAPPPSPEDLKKAMALFIGVISQVPPVYSAIHVDGRRAHELTRSGVVVDMPSRQVVVETFELLSYDGSRATVRVRCSKGTYIRSLARDLALACASRAHLISLRRTAVAGFSVLDALDLAGADDPVAAAFAALKRPDGDALAALGIASVSVDGADSRLIRDGRPFDPESRLAQATDPFPSTIGILGEDGGILAVMEKGADRWRYAYVAPRPEVG